MSQKKTDLIPVNDNTSVLQQIAASDIKTILELVEKGQIGAIDISADKERKRIIIDSTDGTQRTILEQRNLPGVTANTHINSIRLPKSERLETVEKLHKDGKTQQEIADIVCVKQRTVSDDIKTLRIQGKIPQK